MNKKMSSLFYRINNYLSHNSIVQKLKYSFQGVLNQFRKFRKIQGVGVWQALPGMEFQGNGGSKGKYCPPLEGMDIFWNYTITVTRSLVPVTI